MPMYNVNDIARLITEDPNVFCEMDTPPPAPMVSRSDNPSPGYNVGKRPVEGEIVENQWIREYQKKIEAIMRHRLNYGTDGDKAGPRIPDDIAKAIPFFAKTCAIHAYQIEKRGGRPDHYGTKNYTFFAPGEGQNYNSTDKNGQLSPEARNENVFWSILDGWRVADNDHAGKRNPKMYEMLYRIKDYEASLEDHIPNTNNVRRYREELQNRPKK